jgi:MarR family 2-MHQ and catechol resistance regulon transcriptional repressor
MVETHNSNTDILLAYNLLRTATALNPHIDRGLRELNLTGSQLNALMVLKETGSDGISLSEIGRLLVVTKANVTGLIDRLERDGLVERRTHADRRVTLAALTAKGAELLAEALPRHSDSLSDLLSFLSDEEKSQLIELLTRFRRGLRENRQEAAA